MLFCILSIHLTTTSTLFPYTTLFRSDENEWLFTLASDPEDPQKLFYALSMLNGKRFAGWIPEDRKSTRLNSSHVAISYAVFCLKKKTHIMRDLQNCIR